MFACLHCNKTYKGQTCLTKHNTKCIPAVAIFDINTYLNETCDKAINFDDFMKSIIIDYEDCEIFMQKRYLSGTIDTLKRKLEELPLEIRPIQYFKGEDKRQNILHVRHNGQWFEELEKDWLYQITAIEDDDAIGEGKMLHLYRSLKIYDDNILSQFNRLLHNAEDYKKRKNDFDTHERKMFNGTTNSFNKIMIINDLLEFAKNPSFYI
jgi:hypothetical protein